MNNKNKQINKKTTVPVEDSMAMRYAYQVGGIKGEKLLKKFKTYSKATVYRHAKKPLEGETKLDKRIKSGIGRPRKLGRFELRKIKIVVPQLREREGSFTSKRVQVEAGLSGVSNRTVRRAMNKTGYKYLASRKKGLLTKKDISTRLAYCKEKLKTMLPKTFGAMG